MKKINNKKLILRVDVRKKLCLHSKKCEWQFVLFQNWKMRSFLIEVTQLKLGKIFATDTKKASEKMVKKS